MMKLAPKKIYDFKSTDSTKKIFSLRGSVLVNTLKPKWA